MAQTAAEVWEEFKPKLVAAREQDRANVALSFLPIIIPLGRFDIAPLTIERLLWLEQVKSPFVTGRQPERMDVLAFLWINSPKFRVGNKYGKRFCLNNCLIRWRKYAVKIGEYMAGVAEQLGSDDTGAIESNWLPQMVDGFASQYHWTAEEILKMPVERATLLSSAMSARVSDKSTPDFSPEADRTRHEMLKAITEANKNG
tara:strand:+ start:10372 stop:10974 length:603 start_codon:yes stop_codon:yes gene_type:complete